MQLFIIVMQPRKLKSAEILCKAHCYKWSTSVFFEGMIEPIYDVIDQVYRWLCYGL